MSEQEQSRGGGDAGPPVLAREVVAEERLEAESLEEAVEDRQRADPPRVEGVPLGVCRFPWPSCILVLIHVSRSRGPCCEGIRGRFRASEARRCRRLGRSVLCGHNHRAKVGVKSKNISNLVR